MKGRLEARLKVNNKTRIFITGNFCDIVASPYFCVDVDKISSSFKLGHNPPILSKVINELDRYAQGQALKNYRINLDIK